MTLEQAKERLTYINQAYDFGDIYSRDDLEAIDTVLKALQKYEKQIDLDYVRENYIPKEKVRKKIEELNSIEWQPGIRTAGKSVGYWKMIGAENILQELLGE